MARNTSGAAQEVPGKGERRMAVALLRREIVRRPFLALATVATSLVAALLEGATLALLALALQLLQGGTENAGQLQIPLLDLSLEPLIRGFDRDTIFIILVAVAVAAQLLRSACDFASRATSAYIEVGAERRVRKELFRQFMTMSYGQTLGWKIGDLASYTEHAAEVGRAIQRIGLAVNRLLLLLVYLGLMFWLSWKLALVSLVALGGLSLVLGRVIGKVRRLGREFRHAMVVLNERTVEFLSGLRIVRGMGLTGFATRSIRSAIDATLSAKKRGLLWRVSLPSIIDSATVLGVAIFLIAGVALLTGSTDSALPRLAAFVVVLYRLAPRVKTFNDNVSLLYQYLPFVERIAGMLALEDKEYLPTGNLPYTGLREGIRFEHVSLSYTPDGRTALSDVSFEIPHGRVVALVGESGSGKSSIVNLLLRLFSPSDGRILVDGTELDRIREADWRRQLAVVDQDTFVFHDSVRQNIALGREGDSDESVQAAARTAAAHDFVENLEHGYDTIVGDRGLRLSGGQRQRIAIARALLRDPDLLILDEATSDLDSEAEREIQESIENLRGERTILMIAHRLSTISTADLILVLEAGSIVERGTHSQLIDAGRRYSHFWQLQSKATV